MGDAARLQELMESSVQVVLGFDDGNGWLRLPNGSFLPARRVYVVSRPQLLRLDEMRLVPAVTPWQGPALRPGQILRTRQELVHGRVTLPPHSLGVVIRIEESDAALVDFGRGPGSSGQSLDRQTGCAWWAKASSNWSSFPM